MGKGFFAQEIHISSFVCLTQLAVFYSFSLKMLEQWTDKIPMCRS